MNYDQSTDNNIHIEDSYQVSKKAFGSILDEIKEQGYGKNVFANRKIVSMKLEWACHNFCYKLGIFKSHAKDVDINWPQKWYVNWAYNVLGCIARIFIS